MARKIQPGQFIILRADEYSERMPLTVADWDREAGTVTCIFMQVGTSTHKLGAMQSGRPAAHLRGAAGPPPGAGEFRHGGAHRRVLRDRGALPGRART